jgi:hypothetical protein
MGVLQAEQQQAAAEGKLQRLQQQQRHGLSGRAGSASAEQLQQQLQEALQKQAAAAGELTAAEVLLAAVLQQREHLQQELTVVTAAAAAAVDAGRDKATTAAAVRLQEAEQAAGQAEAAVEEAWQLVHKAEQQQKRAAGRAAAISKEVAKVQAALNGTALEDLQVGLCGCWCWDCTWWKPKYQPDEPAVCEGAGVWAHLVTELQVQSPISVVGCGWAEAFPIRSIYTTTAVQRCWRPAPGPQVASVGLLYATFQTPEQRKGAAGVLYLAGQG